MPDGNSANAGFSYEDAVGSPAQASAAPSGFSYEDAVGAPASSPQSAPADPGDGATLTVTRSAATPAAPAQTDGIAQERGGMGMLGTVDAAVRGAARAVPFMDDIAAVGNTGLSYLPEAVKRYVPGTNPKDQSGESFGQRYSENLARERGIDAYDDSNRPVASYGGQLAGALAVPIGPADAAATAAGRVVGPKLATAIGTGAVGAGYGALYGAGEGDGLSDRLQRAKEGALFGGVAGAVAPAIVGGATNLGKAIAAPFKMATNPDAVAAARVAGKLGADAAAGHVGMTADDVAAARATGQSPVIADLGGEGTKALGRSAANLSPDGRSALTDVANTRFGSQNTRFSDYTKSLFGNDLDNQAVRDQLASQAKAINGPAYRAAYAKGAGGVWDSDLAALVQAPDMQSAIADATRKGANSAVLNGNQIVRSPFTTAADGTVSLAAGKDGQQAVPTLQYWDQVKRALDDKISVARRGGNNEDARDFNALKQVLVGKLDEAVPEYRAAREGAYKTFGAENALEAGEKFLGMSQAANIDAVRKSFSQMDPKQREFFAQGLASQIAQKSENASERRNIVNLFNSPQTLEKMQLGLGEDRANQVEAYLRREEMMDRLRTSLGNSTTARQTAEMGEAQGHGHGGHGLMGMVTSSLSSPLAGAVTGGAYAYHEHGFDPVEIGRYAAGGAFGGLIGKYVKHTNEGVVRRVGELLASEDPKDIAKVTQQIARNGDLRQAFRRAEITMSGVAGQVGGSGQPQAALPARAVGGSVFLSETGRGGIVGQPNPATSHV